MKILLIGSGGREHAIAWRLRRDDPAVELFTAPGNAGTAQLGANLPISATDLDGLLAWAQRERPDLTIVGPEAPLCAGVVDHFESAGLPIFGPNRAAARLEGSKVFTKQILLKHGLPTAPGECFTDSASARVYLEKQTTYPLVLKADGLAAGKGVIIAQSREEALVALGQIMDERIFGDAGAQLVIEDFLPGREMSVHVLSDGQAHLVLPIAQDHKKLGDGDSGPNTGGMGAYAPAPFATPELQAEITRLVVEPTLAAFRAEGIDFRGILFIGLMWTKAGPSILEFNVRGGDPETQVLLPLIDTPLVELLQAVREQRLGSVALRQNSLHAVTVVMAAAGYPGTPETGAEIGGLEGDFPGSVVFHAGTKLADGKVVTAGGRVLSVTGWAEDLATARERAYQRVAKIHFAGCQYRRDIAARLTLNETD
jgi:phosphoribosylamine--glycine ligase